MDRRKFLSGAAAATTFSSVGVGQKRTTSAQRSDSTKAGEDRRPNVLVLMSDQHKRTCMGVAGDRVSHTPSLDTLAQESIRFTNAYCSNPVCGPSRASIMTGLYTFNLETCHDAKSYAFSPKHKTIAHQFGTAGYLTALIGKMHFVDAQTHGFDYHLDFNDWFGNWDPRPNCMRTNWPL